MNTSSLWKLYVNIIKRLYICSSIEDSEVAFVFERNNEGLKRLSSFDLTDNWLICLPERTCLSNYVLNCEKHFFLNFDLHYPAYGLIITGLARVVCVLLLSYNKK
jgi:hypothetical protein